MRGEGHTDFSLHHLRHHLMTVDGDADQGQRRHYPPVRIKDSFGPRQRLKRPFRQSPPTLLRLLSPHGTAFPLRTGFQRCLIRVDLRRLSIGWVKCSSQPTRMWDGPDRVAGPRASVKICPVLAPGFPKTMRNFWSCQYRLYSWLISSS